MVKSAEKKTKKRKSEAPAEATAPEEPVAVDGAEQAIDGQPEKKLVLSPIATPLADAKLKKRTLKLVKKAAVSKQLKRGVKEVVKALRKGSKGLCIIAGDISPIDVITHLPIMCEDRDIPYIYVPSKEELGAAGQTKRPSSCMLIPREPLKNNLAGDALKDFQELYDDVFKRVKAVQVIF